MIIHAYNSLYFPIHWSCSWENPLKLGDFAVHVRHYLQPEVASARLLPPSKSPGSCARERPNLGLVVRSPEAQGRSYYIHHDSIYISYTSRLCQRRAHAEIYLTISTVRQDKCNCSNFDASVMFRTSIFFGSSNIESVAVEAAVLSCSVKLGDLAKFPVERLGRRHGRIQLLWTQS